MDISGIAQDIAGTAQQGLTQAEANLNSAAANLVNAAAPSSAGASDSVDISTQILELLAAQTEFNLNLSSVEAADQVQQSTINLLA